MNHTACPSEHSDWSSAFLPPRHAFANSGASKQKQRIILSRPYPSPQPSAKSNSQQVGRQNHVSPTKLSKVEQPSAQSTLIPVKIEASEHPAAASITSSTTSQDSQVHGSETVAEPSDDVLRDIDIVCGRGTNTQYHPGNEAFRSLIKQHQVQYIHARRAEKALIATKIVFMIKSDGSRFMKKDKARNIWYDIGERKSYEKVCQSLRDFAPEMRRRMIASKLAMQRGRSQNVQRCSTPSAGNNRTQTFDRSDRDTSSHKRDATLAATQRKSSAVSASSQPLRPHTPFAAPFQPTHHARRHAMNGSCDALRVKSRTNQFADRRWNREVLASSRRGTHSVSTEMESAHRRSEDSNLPWDKENQAPVVVGV